MRNIPIALLLSVLAVGVQAHPVSYKDAVSVMTWNQPESTDWMTTYSFARRSAVAGRYLRVLTQEGEIQAHLAQLNHRWKRWNGDGYQANIYTSLGGGGVRFLEEAGEAGIASLEADHESRWHYLAVKGTSLLTSEGPNVHWAEYRAGLAAYPAEYEELSAWFIVSFQHNPQMVRNTSFTPLLRLFYKNMLAEVGGSAHGEWMTNFMVHF